MKSGNKARSLAGRLTRMVVGCGLATSVLALAACSRTAEPVRHDAQIITVYKNASCGCCGAWVQHLRAEGFAVETHNVANLQVIKERAGIPLGLGSCHTGQAAGYFVEGHVPAQDIERLLREHPQANGLLVPGMPAGSPGMETPAGDHEPYDVLIVAKDGSTRVFAHHGG